MIWHLARRTRLLLLWLVWLTGLAARSQEVVEVGPVVSGRSPEPGFVSQLTEITVTFDRPVRGVSAAQLLVNGTPARSASGTDNTYVFSFPQPPYGPVDVTWGPLHSIFDLATPPNRFSQTGPGATWSYQLTDPAGPRVLSQLPVPGITLRRLGEVEVRFVSPVRNVSASALRLNGIPATQVVGAGAGPYRFSFVPAPAGPAQLSWSANPGIESDEEVPVPFTATDGWSYVVEPALAAPDVVINELMADNNGSLRDEDGDVEDWVELHNRGPQNVNLAGWALSVSREVEAAWVLPPLNVPAGGRIYLWCSAKDRTSTTGGRRVHTDFKLNESGDTLRLFGPELPRTLADAVEFPAQYPDYSYGRDAAGEGTNMVWRYFARGTPGLANGSSTITGKVDEVYFSVRRGYFATPFNLSLATTTPGAVIRYTTNGSPPGLTNGATYTQPIPVASTRVIRAAAFGPGTGANPGPLLPSRVQTHTYLYNIPANRRLIPAISLVTATNNLYGRTGIMEYNPRNTDKHGKAWERPVSAELIRPGDNGGFQLDCGLRVAGGDYIRGLYNYRAGSPPENKYSYRLYFRGEYGPGNLNYPIFDSTTVGSFNALHLRAGMNDSSNPLMKDEFVRATTLDMGITACHGTFVHLFLNGVYRGIYNPCERVESEFLAQYEGQSAAWDVIGAGNLVIDGDSVAWAKLRSDVRRDLTIKTNFLNVANQIDLENFVDYLLPPIWSDNDDWPHNNTRAARPRVPGGKFRFYPWDAEFSFGDQISRDTIANQLSTTSPPWGTTDYQQIFNALKKSPEFKLLFADRIHRAFYTPGGPLTTNRLRERYEIMKAGIAPSISGFNNIISTWINNRPRYLTNIFNKAGFLQSSNAPGPNRFGGRVARGFTLTLTNRSGDIWLTTDGTDPRIPFASTVSPKAKRYEQPLTIAEPTRVLARSLNGTNWSAVTDLTFEVAQVGVPVRFAEINYQPPGGEGFEFIELRNVGTLPVDLSGFSFRGVTFRFPTQTPLLAAGERRVVANVAGRTGLFATRFPGVPVGGWYEGSLSNGGERLELLDLQGDLVEAVEYRNSLPWPKAAAGLNASLERINPNAEGSDPAGWRASVRPGGSPGESDDVPVPPLGVRLNEIQVGASGDWIELHHSGNQVINLAGWTVTDFSGNPAFVFPAGTTISPAGYLLVEADGRTNRAGFHAGFALNREGETVGLYDASGAVVDLLTFGPSVEGFTLGRVGGDWTLTLPTRGTENAVAAMGAPAAVTINEFLANPVAGADDRIEFHNQSELPVRLSGCTLTTSNAVARITTPTFIAPGGFVVLRADGQPGAGHLDLKLPATGERLVLYDADGNELVRLVYPKQTEAVTYGRIPDGSGPFQALPFAETLGASNYVAQLGSRLRFSEFMARGPGAGAGFSPWVELENVSTNPVSLGGFTLRIDPGQNAYVVGFGVGDILRAGERLLKPATLPANGAVVTLLDPQGQLMDRLEYGPQLAGRSVGLDVNGWALQLSPTPGVANAGVALMDPGTSVRINEWRTQNSTNSDDFVELYNPGANPVDLGGWVLTDDPSLSGVVGPVLTPLTLIEAGGFLRLQADGDRDKGAEHLSFKLASLGESLRLLNRGAVIDGVDYAAQVAGVSEGRFPDGATLILRFPGSPTPASANRRLPLDEDRDGADDTWEILNGFSATNALDAADDADGDGFENGREFQAGTNPRDAASTLAVELRRSAGGGWEIGFQAQPGRSYRVQYLEDPLLGWRRLGDVPAGDEPAHRVRVIDSAAAGFPGQRMYRVQTPVLP